MKISNKVASLMVIASVIASSDTFAKISLPSQPVKDNGIQRSLPRRQNLNLFQRNNNVERFQRRVFIRNAPPSNEYPLRKNPLILQRQTINSYNNNIGKRTFIPNAKVPTSSTFIPNGKVPTSSPVIQDNKLVEKPIAPTARLPILHAHPLFAVSNNGIEKKVAPTAPAPAPIAQNNKLIEKPSVPTARLPIAHVHPIPSAPSNDSEKKVAPIAPSIVQNKGKITHAKSNPEPSQLPVSPGLTIKNIIVGNDPNEKIFVLKATDFPPHYYPMILAEGVSLDSQWSIPSRDVKQTLKKLEENGDIPQPLIQEAKEILRKKGYQG